MGMGKSQTRKETNNQERDKMKNTSRTYYKKDLEQMIANYKQKKSEMPNPQSKALMDRKIKSAEYLLSQLRGRESAVLPESVRNKASEIRGDLFN